MQVPDSTKITCAGSMISINYIPKASIWTGFLSIKSSAEFFPEKSYMKDICKNDYSLNHEQKHFDIGYYFAMKFQKMAMQKRFSYKESDKLRKLYEEIYDEYYNFQEKYDQITDHGTKVNEQEKYDKMISDMLNEL